MASSATLWGTPALRAMAVAQEVDILEPAKVCGRDLHFTKQLADEIN